MRQPLLALTLLLVATAARAEPPRAFVAALKEGGGKFDALDDKGGWADDYDTGKHFFDIFPAKTCRLSQEYPGSKFYTYTCPAQVGHSPAIVAEFQIDHGRTGRLSITSLNINDNGLAVPVEADDPRTQHAWDFRLNAPAH